MAFRRIALALLAVSLVATASLVPAVVPEFGYAHAQQNQRTQRMPNFLDLLFGGGLRKQFLERQKANKPKARRVIVAPGAGKRSATASQPAPKEVVDKAENAAKILVIGDFMADALHSGLQFTYAENPNVVFVNETSGLSGMVRDDVVNWPEKTKEAIAEVKPVAVIVQVGMNDRQQMRLESGRVAKLSDEWKAEYERRVEATVKAVRDANLTLIWMGLPPVKSGAMSSDYVSFNEIFRTKVEAAGGRFADVWDGFTNAEGKFVSAGPDVNGQIVRLRNSDGINVTRAGQVKLAFYAEKEIRKALGIGAGNEVAALRGQDRKAVILEPEYDPATSGRTVVMLLDGPQADGGEALDGAEGFLAHEDASKSTGFELVAKGEGVRPREGRIDAGWGLPAPGKPRPPLAELKARGLDEPAGPAETPASASSE